MTEKSRHVPPLTDLPRPSATHTRERSDGRDFGASFSTDHIVLRDRFLKACETAGVAVTEFPHPLNGPHGERLATHVARLGNPAAKKMLIVVSGVYGTEGAYGSACQTMLLEHGLLAQLNPDTAVLLIHLINPWGVAWSRRTNEDNVDLNKNFIDWSRSPPVNGDYELLHPIFACPEWEGPLRDQAEALIDDLVQKSGDEAFRNVVGKGQYGYADGPSFGGDGPVWSNRILHQIVAENTVGVTDAVCFDLHTGAGPYGHAELMMAVAEDEYGALANARQFFDPAFTTITIRAARTGAAGVTPPATGSISQAMLDMMPHTRLMQLVIKCGTGAAQQAFDVLRADHWLHHYGDPDTLLGQRIKRDLLERFIPSDADWRDLVLYRSLQFFRRGLDALETMRFTDMCETPLAGETSAHPVAALEPAAVTTARLTVPPAILVQDLRKSFGALPVLNGISLTAHQGDVISIIGASGSGKSTALRCINLLETPDAGRIEINGELIRMKQLPNGHATPADRRQVDRIRASVGMVFQSFNLWSHLTVLENVIEAPISVLKTPRKEATDLALTLLEKVGLADKRDHYPSKLSGGQQQRAAIARTLAMQPKVMLFDEPTSALDPELVGEVLRVIRRLVEEGNTMLLVTHEMRFAREVSSRILFLHNGMVEEEGSPDELFDNPKSERTRYFLKHHF